MKKVQTLALALALVALGSVSWAATSLNLSRSIQKPPETTASNLNLSKSNINRLPGKVTQVDAKDNTFAVAVTFSAAKLSNLPTVREIIDITYTETPGGGPMEATTINMSKSNSSERMATDNASLNLLNAEVTEVNKQAKTFTVAVHFSAANLSKIPTVGEIFDITYTQTPDGRLKMISCAREAVAHPRLCAQAIRNVQRN